MDTNQGLEYTDEGERDFQEDVGGLQRPAIRKDYGKEAGGNSQRLGNHTGNRSNKRLENVGELKRAGETIRRMDSGYCKHRTLEARK